MSVPLPLRLVALRIDELRQYRRNARALRAVQSMKALDGKLV